VHCLGSLIFTQSLDLSVLLIVRVSLDPLPARFEVWDIRGKLLQTLAEGDQLFLSECDLTQ